MWGAFGVLSLFCDIVLHVISRKDRVCFLNFLYCCFFACDRVSMHLPHGNVGRSVACDCGISWSYSLIFVSFQLSRVHHMC